MGYCPLKDKWIKKIGALDCNWCIILFKKFVERNEFWGGGDQRFGGGGGDIPGLPLPLYETPLKAS